jgi:Ca2+/H+ antiporter, TMEM165/GDT1 family
VELGIIGTAFAVVFLAELPDKTALATLVLATRYRPQLVFLGAACGFAVQVCIAVAAGSLLALLPQRTLEAVVAVLFLGGAALLLRHGVAEPEPPGGRASDGAAAQQANPVTAWRAVLTSFTVVAVAEFGDLTQIVTANLAAKYDWLDTGIGALAGLCAVALLAILGGRALLRVLPLVWIVRAAALVMAVLAALSLVAAIRG